jgi:hypothetical protein
MHITIPRFAREAFGLSARGAAHDEGLLAGPGEEQVQALGATAPVLAFFNQDTAAQCPDLVHEAQIGLLRRY